jgi:hypothetical protein
MPSRRMSAAPNFRRRCLPPPSVSTPTWSPCSPLSPTPFTRHPRSLEHRHRMKVELATMADRRLLLRDPTTSTHPLPLVSSPSRFPRPLPLFPCLGRTPSHLERWRPRRPGRCQPLSIEQKQKKEYVGRFSLSPLPFPVIRRLVYVS